MVPSGKPIECKPKEDMLKVQMELMNECYAI